MSDAGTAPSSCVISASYLTFLCLDPLISEVEMLIVSHRVLVKIKRANTRTTNYKQMFSENCGEECQLASQGPTNIE